MSVLSDYHLHSAFSGDSRAPMEAMIKRGISLGLKNMCFTEHMDIDFIYPVKNEQGMFEVNTDSYLYDLIKLKEKYAGEINIYFGIELGLQSHIAKELLDYTKSYDFDFIIGSSHLCNKMDPYYPSFYEGRTEEEAYGEYFSSIIDNLKVFDNFDVYGHLDYVVRYGPEQDKNYSYNQYKDILDQVLMLLIEKGKGLEINTGATAYHLKELNPCTDILKRYRELGGEIITIGSDAHTPERVGGGFSLASGILKECGFKYYTIFAGRMPEYIRL